MSLARNLVRRRWSLALAVLLLLAAAAFGAWRLLRAVPLELASAVRGSIAVQVAGPGTVQARVPVTLSARLTSTILDVAADVGDTVQAGQVLVTLDARDLSARRGAVLKQQESVARQFDAAEATVAKARADLDLAHSRQRRDADLHAQGFLSLASLDTSTAGARAAEAALRSAEAARDGRRADQGAVAQELQAAGAQLTYMRLTTPMAGVVVQRLAEPGTTVAPGTPILRLVDPRTLWVATRVDEALVARVMPGQPASIRLRSGSVHAGRVERIAMQSDAATRELDVHVAFAGPPPRVAIDQEADVRIEVGREQGLVLPAGALLQDGSGRSGVLQVVAGRTAFVPVVTGAAGEGRVLVREGLKEGDAVVANASAAKPGVRVRPLAR
jgi:HlyD family secretion protein